MTEHDLDTVFDPHHLVFEAHERFTTTVVPVEEFLGKTNPIYWSSGERDRWTDNVSLYFKVISGGIRLSFLLQISTENSVVKWKILKFDVRIKVT